MKAKIFAIVAASLFSLSALAVTGAACCKPGSACCKPDASCCQRSQAQSAGCPGDCCSHK